MLQENNTSRGKIVIPEGIAERAAFIVELAERTLVDVMTDTRAQAAAKVSAAHAILDRADKQTERLERAARERELGELSAADLETILRQLMLKRNATNAQDAQVIGERPGIPLLDQ